MPSQVAALTRWVLSNHSPPDVSDRMNHGHRRRSVLLFSRGVNHDDDENRAQRGAGLFP